MEIIDVSRLIFAAKTKQECNSELIEARWKGQFKCPKCAHERGYWISSRALYECANRNCRKQTSPTAGTQFHKSRDLESVWIILKSTQLETEIRGGAVRARTGVSYSSARRMIQKFCALKILSITLIPPTENNSPQVFATSQNSSETITGSTTVKWANLPLRFHASFPCFPAPEIRLNSIRAISIDWYLRQLVALICPEVAINSLARIAAKC